MSFPNFFDDSEGAEEYSYGNPRSKHYDPRRVDEEKGDPWPDDVEAQMLGYDDDEDESIDDNIGIYDFMFDADCASCLAQREHTIEEHEDHLRRSRESSRGDLANHGEYDDDQDIDTDSDEDNFLGG